MLQSYKKYLTYANFWATKCKKNAFLSFVSKSVCQCSFPVYYRTGTIVGFKLFRSVFSVLAIMATGALLNY